MSKDSLSLLVAVVAVLIALGAGWLALQKEFGAGTRFPNGLSTTSESPAAAEVQTTTLEVDGTSSLEGDVTLGGGSGALVLTHTNSATSTATVGCINSYATSTLTPIKLSLGIGVLAATTTHTGATPTGFVFWGYGTCP